jgi:hypothetical protein
MWRNAIFEGGDDCDTDLCLVVGKVRERLSMNKQTANNFDVDK